MEQVLLPLPKGRPRPLSRFQRDFNLHFFLSHPGIRSVLHDPLQPDDAEDRFERDVQIEGVHQARLRLDRQALLLRHHPGGQVSDPDLERRRQDHDR